MGVDPGEIAGAAAQIGAMVAGSGAAGYVGKRLFGPVLDEIGKSWAETYSDHRKRNLQRIVDNAYVKGRERLETGHEASPRVVNRIIEDGSWAEGPLMAEYFGGIWAASLSPDGGDDRGLVWADLVSRLAAQDVYMHYLAYDAFRQVFLDRDIDLGNSTALKECRVYVPMIEINGIEAGSIHSALLALRRESLIGEHFAGGNANDLSEIYRIDAPARGVGLTPSVQGVELFLWAHGIRRPFTAILDSDVQLDPVEDIVRVNDAQEIAVMREDRHKRQQLEQEGG